VQRYKNLSKLEIVNIEIRNKTEKRKTKFEICLTGRPVKKKFENVSGYQPDFSVSSHEIATADWQSAELHT